MAKDPEQSVGAVWENWRNSDLPLLRRVAVFTKNELRKAARLKTCCGHPGEPGC